MAKTAEVEAKTSDFLDEFKQVERAIRAKALAKMLSKLKEKAHEVLELKEYTNAVLEELGVEESDCKRLIDWINSLEQVKLSKSDKENIRGNARDDVRKERKEAEKKMPDNAFIGFAQTGTLVTTASNTGGPIAIPATYTTSNWDNSSGKAFNYVAGNSERLTSSIGSANNTFMLEAGANSLSVSLK